MPKYSYSINADDDVTNEKRDPYGLIAQYEFDASSEEEARGSVLHNFAKSILIIRTN